MWEHEVVADSQPGHIDQTARPTGAVYRLIDQLTGFAYRSFAPGTTGTRQYYQDCPRNAGSPSGSGNRVQEPGSRAVHGRGLVVETEAWHYLSLRISRGEIFLRCATSAASWWWRTGWNPA